MAESAAYARRGFSGAAVITELASGITSGATNIDCADLSTYAAADDNGPFRVTISDGTTEEEIEVTSVSGNTLQNCTRGVGGTTAAAWSAGASVEHTSSIRDYDEANRLVNLILGVGSVVAGDMYWVSAASGGIPTTLSRIAKGTAGQALITNGTTPSWGNAFASDVATVATEQLTASDTFTDLSTAGPAVTLTTGTKALVTVTAQIYNATATGGGYMGFAVSGASTVAAATSASLFLVVNDAGGNDSIQASWSKIVTGLTAGSNTFTAKYRRAVTGTAGFVNRSISVMNLGS